MALKSNRWITLRLLSIAPLTVVEVSDNTNLPPRILSTSRRTFPGQLLRLAENPWLSAAIREATEPSLGRSGVPPVFLDSAPELDALHLDLKQMFREVLMGHSIVQLPRAQWEGRSPFMLPLKLAVIGDQAAEWIYELKIASWARGPDAQTHGLLIQTASRDSAPLIHAFTPHIVVTSNPDEV